MIQPNVEVSKDRKKIIIEIPVKHYVLDRPEIDAYKLLSDILSKPPIEVVEKWGERIIEVFSKSHNVDMLIAEALEEACNGCARWNERFDN